MEKKKIEIINKNNGMNDNIAQYFIEEGKKLAEKDFAKFSAIIAVGFSAGLWVVKSAWYAYLTGRFSVYKIDKCYINVNSENIFLQIIQLLSVLAVIFFINYMYYIISTAEDKSKFGWKRKRNILLFWLLEMISLFFMNFYSNHIALGELVEEITVKNVLSDIIATFILCLMINVFALEFLFEDWRRRKRTKKYANKTNEQENISNKMSKKKRIKNMFFLIVFTIAIELIVMYFCGANTEYNKCAYKVIMIQSELEEESMYAIEIPRDNNTYEIYPVVYENQDCYIVTRLYHDEAKILIDYDYQKIVEKSGQETIYMSNVYEMGNLKK